MFLQREKTEVRKDHLIRFTIYSLKLGKKGNHQKFGKLLDSVNGYFSPYVLESAYHWEGKNKKLLLSAKLTSEPRDNVAVLINLHCDLSCGCNLVNYCPVLCESKLEQELVRLKAVSFSYE